MSDIIMANIRLLVDRLRCDLEAMATEDFTIDDTVEGIEREKRCESIRNSLESFMKKIEKTINQMENENWLWADLLSELPVAQKANEIAIFDDFALGVKGHLTLMEHGREISLELADNLRLLKNNKSPVPILIPESVINLRKKAQIHSFIDAKIEWPLDKNIKPYENEFMNDIKYMESAENLRKMTENYLSTQAQIEWPSADEKMIKGNALENLNYGLWEPCETLENNDETFPVFSPIKSKIVRILYEYYHENFWIEKRCTMKLNVLEICLYCARKRLKLYAIPQKALLRKESMAKSKIFEYYITDFGIYLMRKYKGEIGQIYVAIFICTSTITILFEAMMDLSNQNCISIVRKFLAKFGKPKNGTQLIKWQFMKAYWPKFEPNYERIIEIEKTKMKSIAGTRKFSNFEEFRNLILSNEKIVNSNPLNYVHGALEDMIKISTSMKIIEPIRKAQNFDAEFVNFEIFNEKEKPGEKLAKMRKKSQDCAEAFWKKFEKEYLQYLRERADKHKNNKGKKGPPEIDEIVLLQDNALPKTLWKLANVIELIKGKDGIICVAKIECKGKAFTRSIDHLYPLELKTEAVNKPKNNVEKTQNPCHKMKLRKRKEINYKEDSDSEIENLELNAFIAENSDSESDDPPNNPNNEEWPFAEWELENFEQRENPPVHECIYCAGMPADENYEEIENWLENDSSDSEEFWCICPCGLGNDSDSEPIECLCKNSKKPCICQPNKGKKKKRNCRAECEKIKKNLDNDDDEPEAMDIGAENLEEIILCPLVFERSRPRQNVPDEYLEEGVFDINRPRQSTPAEKKRPRRKCTFCEEWHFDYECQMRVGRLQLAH